MVAYMLSGESHNHQNYDDDDEHSGGSLIEIQQEYYNQVIFVVRIFD